MSLVLLLVLASPPEGLDVSAHAGVGLRQRSTGDGVGVGFAYGASAGYDLGRVLAELPLRAELAFVSDTFGGGAGVDAVDVSSWQGELMALVGLDWVAATIAEDQGVRLQLVAGPGLRLTWVNIRVLEEEDSTWSAAAFAAIAGGVFYDWGPLSFGVRGMWGAPRARVTQLYASATWRL